MPTRHLSRPPDEPGQAAVYTEDLAARFGAVRCPTQILWGLEARWIAPGTGRRLQGLIHGAPLREISDCGHLMQEDAPGAIIAAVLSFLR